MTITLEELKQKYTELEAMIKSFEEQQREEQQEEAEFPKEGNTYYLINSNGSIHPEIYESEYDREAYLIGNCFRTQEEAEFAVEQFKVIAEMKRCGVVWKTNKDSETLYTLLCNNEEICIHGSSASNLIPIFWFPTEEAAQKAIDTIGKERLLKYWFGVEVYV